MRLTRSASLHLASLAAILGLAALLRFYALPQRGFIYWDEAKFALEGIRVQAALQALLGSHVSLVVGKAVGTAKPTHALLIGLAYGLFGVHDYAPLLLNAAASVAAVALLYLIARRLFGPLIGLLAALFLAVSQYDIIYARSALSESDANVFLLAGLLIWLAGWEWSPSAPEPRRARSDEGRMQYAPTPAGVLMGIAFTTNYRLIVYIVAAVAFDLVWSWRQAGWRRAGWRALGWLGGLAVAPLLWQLVDLITRARGLALFRSEITGRPTSYLGQAFFQLHEGKQSVLRFQPLLYLQWYVVREGWPMSLLILLGLALALWRRSFPWLVLGTLVIVPYLVYVFAPFVVPRNLDATLPFASTLAAAALWSTLGRLRSSRLAVRLTVVAALLLALLGAAFSWRLTATRSGFAQAASYVRQHGNGRALTSSEIVTFYLRGSGPYCNAPRLTKPVSRLASDIAVGYHYAVVDGYGWVVTRFVRDHMQRVARFLASGHLSLDENLIRSENSHPPSTSTPHPYVDVYRLDARPVPTDPPVPPDVCDRNRV